MIIKTNDIFKLITSGSKCAVYLAGDLGGGTATLGYVTPNKGFVAFTKEDGTDYVLEVGKQYSVSQGFNCDLNVKVVGAVAPDLELLALRVD